MYRAFSAGRFKCAGASPKITIGEYQSEGYVLVIKKNLVTKFCLGCLRDFVAGRSLRTTEDENYLTIHSI